jgi:hypothetical protein
LAIVPAPTLRYTRYFRPLNRLFTPLLRKSFRLLRFFLQILQIAKMLKNSFL